MKSRLMKRLSCEEHGLTLLEMVLVISVMGILFAIVAGSFASAIGNVEDTTFRVDSKTISAAATGFFAQATPRVYPVAEDNDGESTLDSDDNPAIFLIDFDAHLPQDESLTFVPYFLEDIPRTATLVSWRVDTRTGKVFFIDDNF